jgi:hypothetical protein
MPWGGTEEAFRNLACTKILKTKEKKNVKYKKREEKDPSHAQKWTLGT